MAYNPYGGPPYGATSAFPGFRFPGAAGAPGMLPPPGLGSPPGMSPAPGLAPPPGVAQIPIASQANRPSGLPASFQPPPNLPNINFNAPVIRLGGLGGGPKPSPAPFDRRDSATPIGPGERSGRSGGYGDRGGDRRDHHNNLEHSRAQMRENIQALVPPSHEERLRTIFLHSIPESVGGEEGIQMLLSTVGQLRKWDSGISHLSERKGALFGFAQYEDPASLAVAVHLLENVMVPLKKQRPKDSGFTNLIQQKQEGPSDVAFKKSEETTESYAVVPKNEGDEKEGKDEKKKPEDGEQKSNAADEPFLGIAKVKLQAKVDQSTRKFLESWRESLGDDPEFGQRLRAAEKALKDYLHNLFYPRLQVKDAEGDTAMGEVGASNDNVEVINIPLAQEDELADIPADMREVVAKEIAAFRERSNQRDLERLRREEEFEEQERRRNGVPRPSRLDSPPSTSGNSNTIPLGPRGMPNAPVGPRIGRGVDFLNGGTSNGVNSMRSEDGDTDASDEELHRREVAKQKSTDEKLYIEAERKWANRERQRAAALERERDREQAEAESFARRRDEQLEKERNWDDEKEAMRKSHLYYRDRAAWVRKRAVERADEEARDEQDRRAEIEEQRRQEAQLEQAKGMADSFLEQQAEEMEKKRATTAATGAAPQRFTISFGAAAQRAQASRAAPQRRTVAEVEGLLDNEEHEQTTKRQLVPIKFEPIPEGQLLSEEDLQKAVRALAQEIPTEREGLWAWEVKWDYLEESVIREKLRPFVEKKIVEYLGVQEQFLVEVVEEHLRSHKKPAELAEELAEALDEDAEDLVKKLWRMVIFFTESEKRGLPA